MDYYYRVRPEEATPVRAAYRVGGAASPFVGLSAGYGLTTNWRLESSMQVLRLDENSGDSSLTNDDETELRTVLALSYVSQR